MIAKKPYQINRHFLPNPCAPLYQNSDTEISQADHVQEGRSVVMERKRTLRL